MALVRHKLKMSPDVVRSFTLSPARERLPPNRNRLLNLDRHFSSNQMPGRKHIVRLLVAREAASHRTLAWRRGRWCWPGRQWRDGGHIPVGQGALTGGCSLTCRRRQPLIHHVYGRRRRWAGASGHRRGCIQSLLDSSVCGRSDLIFSEEICIQSNRHLSPRRGNSICVTRRSVGIRGSGDIPQ